MDLPIVKITDPTLAKVSLDVQMEGLFFGNADWVRPSGALGDFYWGDVLRGELPNEFDADTFEISPDSYDSYVFEYGFMPDFEAILPGDTEASVVPWYFSTGENVRLEQDDTGTYLALQGEESETWISLDVIEAGVGLEAKAIVDLGAEIHPFEYWKMYSIGPEDWDAFYADVDIDELAAKWGLAAEEFSHLDDEGYFAAVVEMAYWSGYEWSYYNEFPAEVTPSIASDFQGIIDSVAVTGGDVFGTSADESVAFDAQAYADANGLSASGPTETVSATYGLGEGSDDYALTTSDGAVDLDIVIDDAGGAADSLTLSPGTAGTELSVDWVLDPETGDYDLRIDMTDPAGSSNTVVVKGQGSDADSQIETFDLGSFGSFTAAELQEAFPQPFEQVTTEDTDDRFGWDSYTDTFDENGVRVSRDLTYDDGRELTTTYENGVQTRAFIEDVEGAKKWDTTEILYDATGAVDKIERVFDDGFIESTDFNDGTKVSLTETDGADLVNWETQVTTYDENGDRLTKDRFYDDGREEVVEYENDIRSVKTITDAADDQNFQTETTTFNEDGERESFTRTLDDGRTDARFYENNVITDRVITDEENAFDWFTITTLYDGTGDAISTTLVTDEEAAAADAARFAEDFLLI